VTRFDQEFTTQVAIEQRLLNAAGELRRASSRLEGPGMLKNEIEEALAGVERALDLARWAKRVALHEWKDALEVKPAA
jgi:hypothetical protein